MKHETLEIKLKLLLTMIPPIMIITIAANIKDQLKITADRIGHDLMIPGDDQKGHISQLCAMLSAMI